MKEQFKKLWKLKPFRIAIYVILALSVIGAVFGESEETAVEAENKAVQNIKEESKDNNSNNKEENDNAFVITAGQQYQDIRTEKIEGIDDYKYYIPAGKYKITATEGEKSKQSITFRTNGEVAYQKPYTSSFEIEIVDETFVTLPDGMQLYFEQK